MLWLSRLLRLKRSNKVDEICYLLSQTIRLISYKDSLMIAFIWKTALVVFDDVVNEWIE